jgi:tripartite-type tricarboxylate transporter receptor subunit TctC
MFNARLKSVIAIGLGALIATAAAAQDYPDKPVKFVLPFPPGGSADAVTRELADKLQSKGNGTFIIENKPGAAGNLATGQVVRAPNDGYTILVGVTGALVINPELYSNLGYNTQTDLTAISMLAQAPVVIVASRESGITSLKDLVQRAKAKPGEQSYATNGSGTSHHLAGELFKQKAGIFMVNIPYKGTPGALQDIGGGRVDAGFLDLTASLPMIASGRIVALATTGATRPSALPNVPTVAEAGFPGYEAMTWISLVAPKGMKREHVAKLSGMVNAVLADDAFKKSTAAKGLEAAGSTPDELQRFIASESEKWRGVIRSANIRLE